MKHPFRQLGVLLILIFFLPLSPQQPVIAEETAAISVSPIWQEIGAEGETLPKPCAIDITVQNITDLYAWQISLCHFPKMLNFTSAVYPPGHVFEGKYFVEVEPLLETYRKTLRNESAVDFSNPVASTWYGVSETPEVKIKRYYNLTGWSDHDKSGVLSVSDMIILTPTLPVNTYFIERIWQEGPHVMLEVTVAYVKFGASLIGFEDTFSGDGTLCRINFEAIWPGYSVFNFSKMDTYLLNGYGEDIPCHTINGSITVLGLPAVRESSTISIKVEPTTVKTGSNVTISGRIQPVKVGVDVSIYYRVAGGTWMELAIVKTSSLGEFSFIWTPTQTGTYEFKVSWPGDEMTEGAESEIVKLTVTEEKPTEKPPPLLNPLYIALAIIIVALIAAIYYLKVKKAKA